jgi:signal transduction histidine kinase
MLPQRLFERYQELQQYVGWSDEDAERVHALAPLVEPRLGALIDDFYAEIDRHPEAKKVITGGAEQVQRLKGTLINWLRELLSGRYDAEYVARRWRVGYRHVEIGLNQVYTNTALSRLRTGLLRIFDAAAPAGWTTEDLGEGKRALNKLLDLDLAIIEDAYQAEYIRRQQQAERLAAIGQVAGGIAHELRNPLNVIKTSVYFLLNARNPSPDKTAEHLKRIEKQVGLADGVITALSNFAKMPVPNMQSFALEPFLREVLENVVLPETLDVVLNVPPELPSPLADVAQMQIVF